MRKLLLADDSVTIQRVIELTFSGEDIQVIAVNDGEQAIARIPAERPDVVLADIGMPRKGGYDVAAVVKGRPDLSHIPVLLLAGAFEPVDQTRAEQVGADGVLIKPFEPRQVIERVKELLAAVRPTISAEVVSDVSAPVIVAVSVQSSVEAPAEPQVQSLDDLFESLNQALTGGATSPVPPASPAPRAEPGAPPAVPSPAVEPSLEAFPPRPATRWPVEKQWMIPTMSDESHSPNGRDSAFLDSASFHDASFDSVPFDAVLSPSTSAARLDDYFDRLSAAFSHTRTAAPSETLPDAIEDFGKAVTSEPPAASHEWLGQAGEPEGLQAFESGEGEAGGNPILGAVSTLMGRAQSHHDTDDLSHTGHRVAQGHAIEGATATPGNTEGVPATNTVAQGHAIEGATATAWNTEGVPATNTGAHGHARAGAAAPPGTPTGFQRPTPNGTYAQPVQRGTGTGPSAPSPELVDGVTERVLARLVPELTESLRRLVREELTRTQ